MKKACGIVIINCFDTYEHRVALLKEHFAARGEEVHVITSDWRHFHKEVRTKYPEGYEAIHVRPYTKNLSADRLISHHQFAKDVFARVEQLRPRLLWVLVPPNSLVKCAAEYKKRNPGTRLVLDLIDMWPETMPIARFKSVPPLSFWRDLRDKYISCADAVVTECGLYQSLLKDKCAPEKLHTLYLARHIQPSIASPNPPEDKTALCYLGSINNIIDIPCICRIVRSIEGPVELHIVGDGEKKDELIREASEAGAQVIFHGKVYDPQQKQEIFDRCHFGMNIMKDSVFVGLTMKSMDYFSCGLPIINNIRGDTWNFVETYALGLNDTGADRIGLQQLREASCGRSKIREFFVDTFSYEIFSEKVTRIVESIEEME